MSQNNPTDKASETKVPTQNPVTVKVDPDLDKEYVDNRTITISLVHNYSNYRKVNMKVLGQRKETIGSSISSCRILASNKDEVEAYFPPLIGLSPNNPDFIARVKAWLSNIQFVVNDNDVNLNISFWYKKKSDFLMLKKREELIDEEYAKVNRADMTAIKEALKIRIDALNALESERYKYGSPINLEEYLMYRHCLLYRDVAKDVALINSLPNIRFYIKDEAKEKEKQKKLTTEKMNAMKNFIELSGTPSKFNAVYIAVIADKGDNISNAIIKNDSEKNAILMDYVNNYPDKFNKLFSDKNIITKAFIETLIVRGELVRAEFNQQISTADGTFIGSNINEAVAYFNNPANKDIKAVYENKIKLF